MAHVIALRRTMSWCCSGTVVAPVNSWIGNAIRVAQQLAQLPGIDLAGGTSRNRVIGVNQHPHCRHFERTEQLAGGSTELLGGLCGGVAYHYRAHLITLCASHIGDEGVVDTVDVPQRLLDLGGIDGRA